MNFPQYLLFFSEKIKAFYFSVIQNSLEPPFLTLPPFWVSTLPSCLNSTTHVVQSCSWYFGILRSFSTSSISHKWNSTWRVVSACGKLFLSFILCYLCICCWTQCYIHHFIMIWSSLDVTFPVENYQVKIYLTQGNRLNSYFLIHQNKKCFLCSSMHFANIQLYSLGM